MSVYMIRCVKEWFSMILSWFWIIFIVIIYILFKLFYWIIIWIKVVRLINVFVNWCCLFVFKFYLNIFMGWFKNLMFNGFFFLEI